MAGAVRIGVAGAGLIGRRHIEEIDASSAARLAAVVDPSSHAQEVADKYGVPLYSSLAELFEKDRPDGVVLATPNRLHVEGGLECVAAGVPVIVEKPIGDSVECARQALAIDEDRMVFAPCLWNAPTRPERVMQVWFEGAHSDVGGGYPQTGLSDTALLWMVGEASRQGLVFDKPLLDTYVNSRSEAERHSSLKWFYRISNLRERIRPRPESERVLFTGAHRNLDAPGSGVMLASSARGHFAGENSSYRPGNLDQYAGCRSAAELDAATEQVIPLPESSQAVIDEQLAVLGIRLGAV